MGKHFDGLDVIRSILALLVASGHFFLWNGISTVVPASFFLSVDFFFVLSGFVLTQSVVYDRECNPKWFMAKFALRRLFRLYPLYLTVLLLTLCAVFLKFGASAVTPRQILTSVALLQGVIPDNSGVPIYADTPVGIGWSVSVELWVSLSFFGMIFLLRRRTRLLALFSAATVACSLLLMISFSPNIMNVNMQGLLSVLSFGAIRGFLGLAAGALTFLLFEKLKEVSLASYQYTLLECGFIILIPLIYLKFCEYERKGEYIFPVIAMACILLVTIQRGFISNSMYTARLSWFREISYSIYLVHPIGIFFFRQMHWSFTMVSAAFYLFLVVIMAVIAHRLIEKPGIALGKRLLSIYFN